MGLITAISSLLLQFSGHARDYWKEKEEAELVCVWRGILTSLGQVGDKVSSTIWAACSPKAWCRAWFSNVHIYSLGNRIKYLIAYTQYPNLEHMVITIELSFSSNRWFHQNMKRYTPLELWTHLHIAWLGMEIWKSLALTWARHQCRSAALWCTNSSPFISVVGCIWVHGSPQFLPQDLYYNGTAFANL